MRDKKEKKVQEFPEEGRPVLALVRVGLEIALPMTGFFAKTIDTGELYFQCFGSMEAFDPTLIEKWHYIEEIAPTYFRGVIFRTPTEWTLKDA